MATRRSDYYSEMTTKPPFVHHVERGAKAAGRLVSKGFAWVSFVWAALYALACALVATLPDHPPKMLVALLGMLAVLSALIGRAILTSVRRVEGELRDTERTQQVLRLARAHEGILSVADVVAGLGLSADDAVAALRVCAREGLAEIDADTRGVLIYRFPAMGSSHPLPHGAGDEEDDVLLRLDRPLERPMDQSVPPPLHRLPDRR